MICAIFSVSIGDRGLKLLPLTKTKNFLISGNVFSPLSPIDIEKIARLLLPQVPQVTPNYGSLCEMDKKSSTLL